MSRPLVLALAVCVLGVAVAVFLSLSPKSRPDGVDVSATSASERRAAEALDLAAPIADENSERARVEPVVAPATLPWTGARAIGSPDAPRGALEILVLREEDETLLVGARVYGRPGSSSEVLGTRVTDADGRARWGERLAQPLQLEATAPGRTTASVSLDFDPRSTPMPFVVRLPAQRDVRVRLVDERGQDVRLAALGLEPTASANLSVGLAGSCTAVGRALDTRGAPSHRTKVDSWLSTRLGWRIQIRGVDPACVHVLLGDVVLAAMPLAANASEIAIPISRDDLQRALEPIVVSVIDEGTRAPIADAAVVLKPLHGSSTSIACDANGIARFEHCFAGEFELAASAPGHAPKSIRARRPVTREIEISMRVGHDVEGIVVDRKGAPKAGVYVAAHDAADQGRVSRQIGCVKSDAAGRFEFELLPADVVVLYATDDCKLVSQGYLPRADEADWLRVVPCRGGARGVEIPWTAGEEEEFFHARRY